MANYTLERMWKNRPAVPLKAILVCEGMPNPTCTLKIHRFFSWKMAAVCAVLVTANNTHLPKASEQCAGTNDQYGSERMGYFLEANEDCSFCSER
jgi:hypothetical protein